MEKINPGITLQDAIREAQEEEDICEITDLFERAAAIADWVRREYPFAWSLKAMQTAAARAVGVPTMRELEREAESIRVEDENRTLSRDMELERLGYSLLAGAGLCLIGNLWQGGIGLGVLGFAVLAIKNTLDKSG